MRLQTLLEDLFNGRSFDGARNTLGYNLDFKALGACKLVLDNLDEFRDANVSVYDGSGNIPLSEFKTYILFDGARFSGDVKLLSIHTGGPISSIDILELPRYSSIKCYDPNDFSPTQKLILSCPILTEDISHDLVDDIKASLKRELHTTIDKMLDHPNDFLIPDKLPIMIRAIINRETCDLGSGEKITITIKHKNAQHGQ